jgi:hypothetical protein
VSRLVYNPSTQQMEAVSDSRIQTNVAAASGTVHVDNTDFPDANTLAKEEAIRALLDDRLTTPDVFGNVITGQRDNQIEVHFDDTNWANYVTTTQTGGGGATQHQGHVHFTTSTGANGRSKAVTLDTVKYRPMHEIYAGWTATFITAGTANSYQRIGLYGDTDGLFVGYEGASFGITHRTNSVDVPIARASWDDPLTGGAGSLFTRDGTPEALNPALANVYRVRLGWLGSAQIIFEVLAPDGHWVTFHTIKRPNLAAEPSLTNPDLPMTVEVRKTAGDATDFELRTACWAGGTTSAKARLSDAITDRSLAETVRAVIEGKNPSGTYTKITVNAQGRLQVTNDSVGTTGAAVPTDATMVGGSDGTNLVAMKVAADGTVAAADAAMAAKTPDLSGTWGYAAGTAATEALIGSKRVIGIAAHATTAGSFTINGGASIPVPANSSIEIQPIANLVDPTVIFTGTDSYFIEHIT